MGLTYDSTGKGAAGHHTRHSGAPYITIALAGNPNVGKSTLFNNLTGMNQHTGNWPGKTVVSAEGIFEYGDRKYLLVDLPGTYSLRAHSPEEEVARDFIIYGRDGTPPDAVAVVCDATCLERNLNLVLQTNEIAERVLVCVNLMDEAKRKGIRIDLGLLSQRLGVPVIGMSARNKRSTAAFGKAISDLLRIPPMMHTEKDADDDEHTAVTRINRAEDLCRGVVTCSGEGGYSAKDRRLDRILTGKAVGYPVMILLLALVFWITIEGANYPSALLSRMFSYLEERFSALLSCCGAPWWLRGALADGAFRVLGWVVSVMLPPMAIFFPLFTLLEDSGYLPRIAYNLDRPFCRCHACGKQALTMCMGFGCNAAGVVGCRIIDSPRERLLAVITNSFVPCNGRFPAIITLLTLFAAVGSGIIRSVFSALMLITVVLIGVGATFLATKLLSITLLRGEPSSFALELPPYRKPEIGRVIVRSLLDRTLFVLGRSAAVAAPAGLVIWALANMKPDGVSLLSTAAAAVDPVGRAIGLDGAILLGFILGIPANEIVLPIIMMIYLASGSFPGIAGDSALRDILISNGWCLRTAVCFVIFSLMHWPCSTTLFTIKKETGSVKCTVLAALIPTLFGFLLCAVVNVLWVLIGG